jgi:hypothetical protein
MEAQLAGTTTTVAAGFQPASRAASLPPVAIGLDARMRPTLAGWKPAVTGDY